MKNIKRTLPPFAFYERVNIETYLEKQAADGWMIDEIGRLFWRFRRIEPQNIHFSIIYQSAWCKVPSIRDLEFREYCAHDGWQVATENIRMQVFFNEAATPTPIGRDEEKDFRVLNEVVKKNELLPMWFLLVMPCWAIARIIFGILEEPLAFFVDPFSYISPFIFIYLGVWETPSIIGYYWWYRRMKKAFREGNGDSADARYYKRRRRLRRVEISIIFGFAVLTACSFFNTAERVYWEYRGSHEKSALGMSFSVEKEDVPLTIEDLTDPENEYTYKKCVEKSIFMQRITYYSYDYIGEEDFEADIEEEPEEKNEEDMDEKEYEETIYDLTYSVFTAPRNIGKSFVKRLFLREVSLGKYYDDDYDYYYDGDYTKIDAAPWGAEQAYQFSDFEEETNMYALCYQTHIVYIECSGGPLFTPEQMKIVGEKLGQPI